MPVCLGIEGGGKHVSMIAVADMEGNIIAAELAHMRLNYHESARSDLAANLFSLIKQSLYYCGLSVSDFVKGEGRICAGLTGISTSFDRNAGMNRIWKASGIDRLHTKIATGRTEIAFLAASRSLCGAALSSHVGSVALARNEHRIVRVGGWGHLLGDEGSGYWIGMQALKAICQWRDKRAPKPRTSVDRNIYEALGQNRLWRELELEQREIAGVSDTDWFEKCLWADVLIALVERTSHDNEFRYIVSEIARAVVGTWEGDVKDEFAAQIVDGACGELLLQAKSAVGRIEFDEGEFPFVLSGGLFHYNPKFVDLISQRIQASWPTAVVIRPDHKGRSKPVIGALMSALSGDLFRLPDQIVMDKLDETSSIFPELEIDR